jgi:hypothetical protein
MKTLNKINDNYYELYKMFQGNWKRQFK